MTCSFITFSRVNSNGLWVQAWSSGPKKMLWHLKTIVFWGQTPKSRRIYFKILNILHGDFCCCVKYSDVEYQDEISKTYH